MNPYREQADKPQEPKESIMKKLKNMMNWLVEVFIDYFPLIFGLVVVLALSGLFYGLNHNDHARRMHQEHDTFVFNQEICRVHHGWYVPSHNIPNMTSCRRLSDHRLFFVQRTGRELVPTEE